MQTQTQRELEELARNCEYSEDYPLPEWASDSVDALIEYKNCLEDRAAAEGNTLDRIAAILAEPEWSVGMMEDIAALVVKHRSLDTSVREREHVLGGPYTHH